MATTRIRGITVDVECFRTINKEHCGERIFARLGLICQEQAERRLAQELERLEWERERKTHARPLFSDCAKRFLLESRYKRSRADIAWHLGLLARSVGDLAIRKVHDETLQPLIEARLADGVSATTINRTLEVARTILHRAARAYRDRTVFRGWKLPLRSSRCFASHLVFRIRSIGMSKIGSFADCLTISPGWRSLPSTPVYVMQTCGLRWSWEVPIAELGRSVFVIPAQAFKSPRAHVVILNDSAWSIIETQRGKHPEWVFSYRNEHVERMNNTAWQRARREAKLPDVRIHDLRHTFATRLRAAGVAEEDRAALLGHATRTMPEHYASADVGRLVTLANRVLDRVGTMTILRVANS